MKKKYFLIIFPLVLGVIIYICFRSKSLFYFQVFNYLDLKEGIIEIRKIAFTYRKMIPNWVIYSLPDGLWIFSFGIAILYNLENYRKRLIIFTWMTVFMLFFEYIQLTYGGHGTIIGTFDVADLYCFVTGYLLSVLITLIRIFKNRKKIKELANVKGYIRVFYENLYTILLFFLLAVLPTLFKIKK